MITTKPTNEQVKAWEKALNRTVPPDCTWICKENVAVSFFNYTGDDIEIAVVGEGNWATHQFITICFLYTFNQLNVHRCTARVAASNLKALNMDLKLGFVLEGVIREALKGEDCLILGMLKTECRWIHHGQKKPAKSTRFTRCRKDDSRSGKNEPDRHLQPLRKPDIH